jgi:hypothetical protein
MTPQEFQYLKRAVEALESGDHSLMSQHKILVTVSQITARAAEKIETEVWDRVEQNIANNHLVKVLQDAKG